MKSKSSVLAAVAVLAIGGAVAFWTAEASGNPEARGDAVVYVTSQGLYYDTEINGPLPPHGPFQLLEMGPNGLQTEWGPGDQGYVGGRWKADFDGDGEFDYFSCPLLGPGRENP
ncbi:MAG: hypothetical protein GY778_01670 [bacterium]|nr:hypothetical protein [bacterium]